MRYLHVTCEACGEHHECARLVGEACSVQMICHCCETALLAPIAAQVLEAAPPRETAPDLLCVVGFALPYQHV